MARHFTLKKFKAKFKYLGRILLVLLILAAILLVANLIRSKLASRKFSNPPGTVGNTPGNLNNGGLFCEYDGVVYFANSYDQGCLYAMTPEEDDIRCLSNACIQSILAGGDYLYFFQTRTSGTGGLENVASRYGFNRTDLKAAHAIVLCPDVVITAQLINDYVYMVCVSPDGVVFRKVLGDGSDQADLTNYAINPASVQDSTIYFNHPQDSHYLYSLDTETDTPRAIRGIPMWYPVVDGQYVYYMDVSHNYRLSRYNLQDDTVEVLTKDRVDCFNVGSGYIYYQKNSTDPQLMCMRTDGTDQKPVLPGNYNKINMTSKYVYFQDFESGMLYHSLIGSDTAQLFDKARVAMQNKRK